MKQLKTILLLLFIASSSIKSQVLISLIFGEVLNTDKVEFGLAGGMNRSYINSISGSEGMNNFDIGFYFHVLLKNNSYLSTGVHVKSNVGATGMATYPVGDASFDDVYKDGTLTKKIPVFYVPILFHKRIKKRWYVEAGPQLGLIYNATDIFEINNYGGELKYSRDVQEEYKRIDAGIMGGVGYKFSKQIKSESIGIQYYYGLVDVSKNPDLDIYNSSIYFFIRIPIGAGVHAKKDLD